MITVPEITQKIILETPFLTESIKDGIINLSALARKIQPKVQSILMKDIKVGAIVMALKRLNTSKLKTSFNLTETFIGQLQDITLKSNLIEYSFRNSDTLISKTKELIDRLENSNERFFTLAQGIHETAIIVNKISIPFVDEIYANETQLCKICNISSITIKLTSENIKIIGVYYMLLKAIAWNNINVVDVLSTPNEITLFFHDKDIKKAFGVIRDIINSQ